MAEYIEKNKVINLIEHNDRVCHYADERYENVVYATAQTICKVVAEMPAADVQPVNQWISVDDKLPDDCVEVLVYDTDCGIVIGWYDKETGDFAADFISPLDAVTHWQPLPEPPKEVNNG